MVLKYNIKFVATGEVVVLNFSRIPALSDVFQFEETYYMVADYDGNFIHVVEVYKHEVTVDT